MVFGRMGTMNSKVVQLMFALITVSWAQGFMVSQPSSAEGMEGSSVTLSCSYNSISKSKVGSYQWVKDSDLVVKNTSQEFMGRVYYTSEEDFLLLRKADIEIRDLRPSDTGLYRCVVSIHGLQETSGEGTELQVKRTFSVAQDAVVSQPSSAQGTEGDSVTLHCSYNSLPKLKVGSYEWIKNPGLVVKNTSKEFMGRVNCTSDQGFLSEKRADIEIKDLRLNDSGIYRCVVNFYGLQEFSGNGTDLQVTKKAGPRNEAVKDNRVLVWLLVRGVLYTTGIVTVAVVTHLLYANTICQEAPKRINHGRENIYKTATRN